MRVAFVGKGGAGKSSLAGTFTRVLATVAAGTPERVLALDSDPMPGLAFSLGVAHSDAGMPDEAVEDFLDPDGRTRYRLRPGLTGTQAVERYGVRTAEGAYLVQLGKASGARWSNTRQHFGFQRVLDDLPTAGWSIVGDLPGGTRQPFLTWGRYARTFLVVVEPLPASLLTGRRLARLAATAGAPRVLAIANKVRAPGDTERVAERTGLQVIGAVPFDTALGEADRTGSAVFDEDPDGPTVRAVRSIVDALRSEREPA